MDTYVLNLCLFGSSCVYLIAEGEGPTVVAFERSVDSV